MKKLDKKTVIINTLIVVIVALFITFCCLFYNYTSKTRVLELEKLDIKLNCVYCISVSELQKVIDEEETAAYFPPFIFDHACQGFYGLWNIEVGDKITFDGNEYSCSFIIKGYSDNGIYVKGGELLDADLYLCTCVPGGEEYEVYIVGANKK